MQSVRFLLHPRMNKKMNLSEYLCDSMRMKKNNGCISRKVSVGMSECESEGDYKQEYYHKRHYMFECEFEFEYELVYEYISVCV